MKKMNYVEWYRTTFRGVSESRVLRAQANDRRIKTGARQGFSLARESHHD